MSRAKMVAIDGEKLKALILTTGSTLPEASLKMGYNRDYIANCTRTNMMPRQAISLIGLMLNIPEELYVPKEAEPEIVPEEPEGLIELLRDIRNSVERIEKYMEEKGYEQKVFNLPFGNDDISCSTDNHSL